MNNLYLGDYKRYLLIPAVLFIVFLFLIFITPGVPQGIDLKGGTSIIVRADSELDPNLLIPILEEKYSLDELQVGSVSSPNSFGLFLQFSENADIVAAQNLLNQAKDSLESNPESAKQFALESIVYSQKFTEVENTSALNAQQTISVADKALTKAEETFNKDLQDTISQTYHLKGDLKFQKREIGPSLGENFFSTGITVALVGLLLVIIVIFIFFREVVPSAAIVFAVLFDVAGALALMALFEIPLSLATIPALLMLIGYSVDTDLMLTTRLLKRREGSARERAHESMITGLTMTFTTLAALTSMIVLSYFGQIQVIYEISAVLLFGLFADILSTWLMNAPILLWYVEKKEGSK
ncbi:MAG: protein translocase subunit SecF [archaeon]|nr:protein translocase subunit SecF [archaeon]